VTEPTIADRRVHPATILLRFLKEAPSTLLALPAGVAILSRGDLYRALAVAAVAGVVFLFFNWLAWRRFRYGVGAREIVIESGILHRNRRSIPFDRVQDVDIERALLARLFGLAKVRIETGAGGKDEGLLDSVTVAEADRLRAAVRAWHAETRPAAGADAGAAEVPEAAHRPEGRLLFAMDLRRVMLFGLFSFSLVYIASLFAFLQTFDRVLPFDIYDPARWIGLVETKLPARLTFAALGFVLFLAVVLGVVAGVLRTVARDYGYRLVAEGGRFRRERGPPHPNRGGNRKGEGPGRPSLPPARSGAASAGAASTSKTLGARKRRQRHAGGGAFRPTRRDRADPCGSRRLPPAAAARAEDGLQPPHCPGARGEYPAGAAGDRALPRPSTRRLCCSPSCFRCSGSAQRCSAATIATPLDEDLIFHRPRGLAAAAVGWCR
jgi:membrane protein YdbS with pleckstrin-like domain